MASSAIARAGMPLDLEHHRRAEPVPIPGGFQVPGGPFAHVFAPGPESNGYQGLHVEPGVITDYKGFTAMAYMSGTARDANGHVYHAEYDMRVFQGDYLAADGSRHDGTFAFV